MKGATCLFSPATALSRVFLLPGPSQRRADLAAVAVARGPSALLVVPQFLAPYSTRSTSSTSTATGAAVSAAATTTIQWSRISNLQQRRYQHVSATSVRRAPVFNNYGPGRGGGGGGGNNKNAQAKFRLGRFPRDEEIRDRYVVLRQEDGSLSEPQQTRHVLSTINLKTESLVVLAMPRAKEEEEEEVESGEAGSEEQTRSNRGPRYPICRIVDRVAERKAEAERAKQQRRRNVRGKELELNWAIDAHDLDHRMDKLREFLEKGMSVEVRLLRKGRGKARATREAATEVLRRVRETVSEVPGARETKAMEGEILRMVTLVVEGPAKKK